MDIDLLLVFGTVLLAVALLSLLSAFTSGRSPIASFALLTVAAFVLVIVAREWPGALGFRDIPPAFERVVARFTR